MGKNSVVPKFRPAALGGARPSVRPTPPKKTRGSETPPPPDTEAMPSEPPVGPETAEELSLDTADVVAVNAPRDPEALPSFEPETFRAPLESAPEPETRVARPSAPEPYTAKRVSIPPPTAPLRRPLPPPASLTPDGVTVTGVREPREEATLFRRPTPPSAPDPDAMTIARADTTEDVRTVARDRARDLDRYDTDEQTIARPATSDERAVTQRAGHDDYPSTSLPATYPADLSVPYDALPSLEVESPYFPGAANAPERDEAEGATRADAETYVAEGKSTPPMMMPRDGGRVADRSPRSGPRSAPPRSDSFQPPVPAFDDESGSHDTHDPAFDMRGGAGWGADEHRAPVADHVDHLRHLDPRLVGTLKSPGPSDHAQLDPRFVGTLKSEMGVPLPPPSSVPSVVVAAPPVPAGFVVGVQPVKASIPPTAPMPMTMPYPGAPGHAAPMHAPPMHGAAPLPPPPQGAANPTLMTSRSVVERRLATMKLTRVAWFAGGIGFGIVVMLLVMNAVRPAPAPTAVTAATSVPVPVPVAVPAVTAPPVGMPDPAAPPVAVMAPPPVIISPPVAPAPSPAIPVDTLAEPAPAPVARPAAPRPTSRPAPTAAPAPPPRTAPRKPAAAPAGEAKPAPKSNPNELQDLLNQALAP